MLQSSFSRSLYTVIGSLLMILLLGGPHVLLGQKDTLSIKKDIDTLAVGASKSGYDDLVADGGANSVDADLKSDDRRKQGRFGPFTSVFNEYYDVKRFLKKKLGIATGVDYTLLNQYATFSFSDTQASSGIFRVFGSWKIPSRDPSVHGSLIFKIENRHNLGPGVVPRNLGYEAGAALSTATFKDFDWGLTNLYWRQIFADHSIRMVLGIMDPGDWVDLYPLLSPFKYYLNEAFFNSPAMAIPNQGLGAVMAFKNIIGKFYLTGGIHDANGEPTHFISDNFRSFFRVSEFMYWAEAGWDFENSIVAGETVHVMYWFQDARATADVAESWGLSFSASKVLYDKYTFFVRGGFAEGNGARMRHILMAGFAMDNRFDDKIGIGVHYGAPNDKTKGNQLGLELFYGFQILEHLNISPNIQLTFHPSFNDEKDVIGVFSVFRIRYAL